MNISTDKTQVTEPLDFLASKENIEGLNNHTNRVCSLPMSITSDVGEIKGPTRVQYVPYQRTIIEYQPVEIIQYIPVERKIIEYQERKRQQRVPVQEYYTDYYEIENITEYLPNIIPEKKIQYAPVQKTRNRVEYYPIQRQIIYNSDVNRQNQRKQYFTNNQQNNNLKNSYSNKEDSRNNNHFYRRDKWTGENYSSNNNFSFGNLQLLKNRYQFNNQYLKRRKLSNDFFFYKSPIQYSIDHILPRVAGRPPLRSIEDKYMFQTTLILDKTSKHNHQRNHSSNCLKKYKS